MSERCGATNDEGAQCVHSVFDGQEFCPGHLYRAPPSAASEEPKAGTNLGTSMHHRPDGEIDELTSYVKVKLSRFPETVVVQINNGERSKYALAPTEPEGEPVAIHQWRWRDHKPKHHWIDGPAPTADYGSPIEARIVYTRPSIEPEPGAEGET